MSGRGVVRVVRNDWSSVTVPDLASWRPTLTVSVVIPAYQCQATLDLTLAALSHQTYPAELLEVTVVDDGSDPPLRLPAVRPDRTRLLRVEGVGWGRGNALRHGARHSQGQILHWLDADMLPFADHVAAQARWHHALPYAVTLGYKRFVDPPHGGAWPAAEQVSAAWRDGRAADLFGGDPGEPHHYVERYIAQTDQLRIADHLAFRIHVGATAALSRDLYEAAGGVDGQLRLGEDTEYGYRLAQAGAVFIPEPQARSWHLGRTHMMRGREEVSRYNRPFLADRVPFPRDVRRVGGTAWSVPLVEVVVPVADAPLERARTAVDAVLRGSEPDVRIKLVGPWDQLHDARVPVLADPQRELRLIAATYRGEPRVQLVTEPPGSAFPSPYLLDLPASYGLAPDALRYLVDLADRHRAGVVRVAVPDGPPIRLWRTAAVSRAQWVRSDDEALLDAVTAVHGAHETTADEVGVIDLTAFDPSELASGAPTVSGSGRRSRLVATTVEVGGVRSLARAAAVVAVLGARRARSWLRNATRRSRRGVTSAR